MEERELRTAVVLDHAHRPRRAAAVAAAKRILDGEQVESTAEAT